MVKENSKLLILGGMILFGVSLLSAQPHTKEKPKHEKIDQFHGRELSEHREHKPDPRDKKDKKVHLDKKDKDGHFDKKGKDGHFDKKDKDGHSDKKDKDGQFDKKDKDGQFDKKGKDGHFDKKDKDGHLDKKDKEGHFDKKDKDGHLDKKDKEGHLDKKDKDSHDGDKEEVKHGKRKPSPKEIEAGIHEFLSSHKDDGFTSEVDDRGRTIVRDKDGKIVPLEKMLPHHVNKTDIPTKTDSSESSSGTVVDSTTSDTGDDPENPGDAIDNAEPETDE